MAALLIHAQAMQMVLLDEPLSGREALDLGLVATLTEPGHTLEGALDLAKRLGSQSRSAVRLAKEAICRGKWQLTLHYGDALQ
jgi:enoyl-CoA hydratase